MNDTAYENLRETIANEIKDIFYQVTGIDASYLKGDDVLIEALEIESLEMVRVLAMIEKRYDIAIDEIQVMLIETFDNFIDLIEKEIKQKSMK